MPNHLKFLLSIAVVLVGAAVYHFEGSRGADTVQWVVVGLACLMILAVWLFPETRRAKHDPG
jgi:uncharacterized protein YqgC (DUF456 family)